MRNSWTCNVTVIMMRSMQFDSVCMIKFSAGYLTGRRKRGKTGKNFGEKKSYAEFFLQDILPNVEKQARQGKLLENFFYWNWSWKLKQKRGRIILCCQRIRRVLEYAKKRAKSNQPKDILNSINFSAWIINLKNSE